MSRVTNYKLILHTDGANHAAFDLSVRVTLYGAYGHSLDCDFTIQAARLAHATAHTLRATGHDVGDIGQIRVKLSEDGAHEDLRWCIDRVEAVDLSTGATWRAEMRGYMAWDDPSNCATIVARRIRPPSLAGALEHARVGATSILP